MHRIRVIVLAFAALLVVAAVSAATASAAAPEFVPAKNTIKEVKSGKGALTGGPLPIECSSDVGGEEKGKGGLVETSKTGKFDVLFLGCKVVLIGTTCTGLEDTTAGSILSKGEFEVGLLKDKTTRVIAFKPKPVHLSCGATLAVVSGCAIGIITPSGKKVKPTEHYTVKVEGTKNKEYINAKGETVKCVLSEEENENGKAKEAGEETTEEVFLELESELT